MTTADAVEALRIRQGAPSLADVPDEWILQGIKAGLRLYARHRGPVTLSTADGTQDLAVYAVPADAVRVLDVFWNVEGTSEPDPFTSGLDLLWQNLVEAEQTEFFDNPSTLHIWYQKLGALKSRFRGRWDTVPAPTAGRLNVRLTPPIRTTGDKVYILSRGRIDDMNRIPEGDIELLFDAAMAEVFAIRMARVTILDSVSFGGASVVLGGRRFAELAKLHRDRFQAQVAPPLGPVH